jgi:outer membrane receptor protein involved in Fe transport
MDVTEFGYKTAWLDNTLIVNGAFFFQDYTDKQVNTQIVVANPVLPGDFSTSPQVINASGAEIPGAEIDITWAPAFEVVGGDLLLSLSYTYLDAEYTDFAVLGGGNDVYLSDSCIPTPETVPNESVLDGAGNPIPVLIPQCTIDRSGKTLEDAPENAAVISGRYEHPFFGGGSSWYFEFDTTFRDNTFLEDVNNVQTDAWWNTNIRLGWRNDRYEAVFFMNNVADDDAMMSGFTTPGLASSFRFNHVYDVDPAAGPCGPGPPGDPGCLIDNTLSANFRGGPEWSSGVPVGSLRPPRHWGIRFAMKFGGE